MNAPIALYKLADEFLEASRRLADLELPDEAIADTLESLRLPMEQKAVSVASFVKNIEASAEAIKVAEEEMRARRTAIENRAKRIRAYLQEQMTRTGTKQIECPYFKLAIMDNPPAVVIDAESQLPDRFMVTPPVPEPVPDKKAIAAALKAGEDVPGAHLERGQRLEIK
jgi:hypothetical protein